MNFFPKPNALDRSITKGSYNYTTQWESTSPNQLVTGKVDDLIRSNDTVSGSYSIQRIAGQSFNGGGLTASFAALATASDTTNHVGSFRHQHIFSPALTNEITFGFVKNGGPIRITGEAMKGLQRTPLGFTAGQLNPASNPLDLLPGVAVRRHRRRREPHLRRPLSLLPYPRQHRLQQQSRKSVGRAHIQGGFLLPVDRPVRWPVGEQLQRQIRFYSQRE